MDDRKLPESETTTAAPKDGMYNMRFFDSDFARSRKQLIGLLLLPLVYTSLLLWGCLGLYFGSLVSNNNLAKLPVYAVDLDGGFLGQQVFAGIKKSQAATPAGLNWRFDATINERALSQETVLSEHAWAVLESILFVSILPCTQN